LCREGYNDPDISCVAIFRPDSKKASSLAEQMKGRGCRPLRSVIPQLNELHDPDDRVNAITASAKPNCLIVDLVGVTGLADCASTVQIYADGLPDEVIELAENILADKAAEEETDVDETIKAAKAALALAKEQAELRHREEAEKRSKAQASATYTEHDIGYGANVPANEMSDGQRRLIRQLGMELRVPVSRNKAGRIIRQLKMRILPDEVAYKNGLREDQWEPRGPSDKQLWKLRSLGIHRARTGFEAGQLIDAKLSPAAYEAKKLVEIYGSADNDELTAIAKDLALVRDVLPRASYEKLIEAGKARRDVLCDRGDAWEGAA
jgi:hypothetical protein